MLRLKNVSCGYDGEDVIKNISFEGKRGEFLCIVGPNGCGKSTLLKTIANLLDYKGDITLDNTNLLSLNRKNLAKCISFMTQTNTIHFPYTVYETVSFGRYAYLKGALSQLTDEDNNIVIDSMKSACIYHLRDKLISELSGGELQRVFLARAFAQDPEIILLDEPTNHLDLKCQIEILEKICSFAREKNKIVIGILHDLNLANLFSDKVVMLSNGKIVKKGSAKEVLTEDTLIDVYNINVSDFMRKSLKKWI